MRVAGYGALIVGLYKQPLTSWWKLGVMQVYDRHAMHHPALLPQFVAVVVVVVV